MQVLYHIGVVFGAIILFSAFILALAESEGFRFFAVFAIAAACVSCFLYAAIDHVVGK